MDKKWWTLIAVGAGTFMLLLDVTIVTVAQPAIQNGLHAGFSDVQWVLDSYALTLASLLLTSGALADRYGRKRLFQTGLVIFTLGSLLCGLAQDPLMLILSRSGQGVGGAIMFATSLALLGNSFRGRDRGVAFGVWGAITGVSTALGPVLGGVITTDWSWRGIFLVNVPIGVLAVALTAWRVEESSSPHPTPPDWAGFALLTAGLVSLIYGLIRAGENSWSDTGVIACLVLGGVALAGFVAAERRVAHPMFDLSLLRVPTFAGGSIAAFAMNGSLYAVLLFLVIYLQTPWATRHRRGLRLPSSAAPSSHRDRRRAAQRAGARPLAHRARPAARRHRADPHGRAVRRQLVDAPDPRLHRERPGRRDGQPAAGLDRDRRGPAAPGRHGVRRQLDVPPGRHRHRHRRARFDLRRRLAAQPGARAGRAALRASAASAPRVATMVRQGQVGQLLASLPAATRGPVAAALRSAFAAGLNDLLLVTGALAFAGALCALLLIRSKAPSGNQQSVRAGRTEPASASPAAAEAGADSTSPARSA